MTSSRAQANVLRYIHEGVKYYLGEHPYLACRTRVLDILVAEGKLAKNTGSWTGETYYERRKFAPPVFTLADIQNAVKVLEANNIAPLECPECKARFYVVPTSATKGCFVCDCGTELTRGNSR